VILLCFGLKKIVATNTQTFTPTSSIPSPFRERIMILQRNASTKTPRTNSRKKTPMQIKGKK
jgi:hypothetical protein